MEKITATLLQHFNGFASFEARHGSRPLERNSCRGTSSSGNTAEAGFRPLRPKSYGNIDIHCLHLQTDIR
jgi:hypothetical protein